MKKKFFKSVQNKVIFGVCGGTAEFLKINPVIIRLVFVALTVFKGLGILLYLLGYLFIPERPKLQIVKSDRYYSKDL